MLKQTTMEYVRQVAARYNYRVPDFSRIFRSPDDTDAATNEPESESLALKFEFLIVRLQELALWTDARASLCALSALHLTTCYLWLTANSGVNLFAWLAIGGFVYTTWTQRVWPEIRVEPTGKKVFLFSISTFCFGSTLKFM